MMYNRCVKSCRGVQCVCAIAVLLLLCRLSISSRLGIVLASRTLHLIMSDRATRHYSEDQMSLGKKGNVLFISLVRGAIYIAYCH